MEQAVCDPLNIAARSEELTQALAAHHQVSLKCSAAPSLPHVLADAPKMAQALSNILRNAIEVSPEDGTVTLHTSASDGKIHFRIDDEGPGIHLNADDDLFSAFFTKKSGGTGLGLSITHRIVTAHEGAITYGNNEKGGAWFELTVPTELPTT